MTLYQQGSLVKLTITFADSSGEAFNPDSIDSVKIYDPDKTQIGETYTSGWVNDSTGSYYLIYELPDDYRYIYVEWNYTNGVYSGSERHKVDLKYA